MIDGSITGIMAIVCSLVFAPAIIFGFILLMKKNKNDIEKAKLKKEICELELRKEEIHLQLLQEENKKYDRVIEDKM